MEEFVQAAAQKQRGFASKVIRFGFEPLTMLLGRIRGRFSRSGLASVEHGEVILKDVVAHHRTCAVNDVASRLRLSMEVTLAAMMELERQGLVRVSKDKIPLNRIVAITKKGRKELKR
jgi:hypothetical protein